MITSWAEHARQHERAVAADRLLEEGVRRSTRAAPVVRHFLYVSKGR